MIYYFIPSEITVIKYIPYIKKTMLYILTYRVSIESFPDYKHLLQEKKTPWP